jgi:hypothetical protein
MIATFAKSSLKGDGFGYITKFIKKTLLHKSFDFVKIAPLELEGVKRYWHFYNYKNFDTSNK